MSVAVHASQRFGDIHRGGDGGRWQCMCARASLVDLVARTYVGAFTSGRGQIRRRSTKRWVAQAGD
eukprot:6203537-Pleurochrysis_carterae.AAC.1